jgi:hypothetical protein
MRSDRTGGDLRLHVVRLQAAFLGVPLSKCKSLAPFRAVQTSFHGIPDELLWGNLPTMYAKYRRSILIKPS